MKAIYENEEIRIGNGFPSLVRFFPGDPTKPLVVFVPGWAHLGRISYGFQGSNKEHFLAHWLKEMEYPFLATSYPIDHPVYDRVYAEFNLTSWGKMAAEIANQFILGDSLPKEVIGISWSAAGQMIKPFNTSCKELGLKVKFHLALEASPALIISSDRTIDMKKTKKYMVSLKDSHYDLFLKEIEEQSQLNGEELIPKENYLRDFLGDVPVALMGTNECFENGNFVTNVEKSMEDKNFFAFTDYPMIASISGDSKQAPYHPIIDKGTWGFLITRKVYHDCFARNQESLYQLPMGRFNELVQYVKNLPDRLHRTVSGNHFLFIGRYGAQKIGDYVRHFDKEIQEIEEEFKIFFR
ncbi:MAG: hypothetical protein L0Y68_03455 [Candidatus Dadabacteria bacterium]|nr:hypothetical protein [Candidatus Dadabacteria bacterium]